MWQALKKIFWRDADQVIGRPDDPTPYMLRWFIIPKNRFFNIYLHKFLRSDPETPHDHPWTSLGIILKGQYIEVTEKGRRLCKRGKITYRHPEYTHRVELIDHAPVWTLFLTGPRVRRWGFHCPSGWIHWKVFDANGGC